MNSHHSSILLIQSRTTCHMTCFHCHIIFLALSLCAWATSPPPLPSFPPLIATPEEQKLLEISSSSGVRMDTNEQLLFLRTLSKHNASYFEFGCGGSTTLVCRAFPNITLACVDSSLEWISRIKQDRCISESWKANRADVLHVDIGETVAWGHPKGQEKMHDWPQYSNAFHRYGRNTSVALVDGRFRVACALVILTTSPSTTLIVHDFANRNVYHAILPFVELVGLNLSDDDFNPSLIASIFVG
jgi:hypothetical protein